MKDSRKNELIKKIVRKIVEKELERDANSSCIYWAFQEKEPKGMDQYKYDK